jgi:predicted ATP-binding protein involved in virulence
MRIDRVYIESFKNLKKFSIDFDEKQMNTVLLGQNATGKSNFIEALILIFKYLDLQKKPVGADYFEYEIKYYCNNHMITASLKDNKPEFTVDGNALTSSAFYIDKSYLPKYVFTYYSGLSDRLNRLFWEHQNRFYSNIIKEKFDKKDIDNLRRLFYVQQVHSYFVLLAFFSFDTDETSSKKLLKDVLHIDDIESALFVLKKPIWGKKNNDLFWGAKGLVRDFLETLWECSLAPIGSSSNVDIDFRHSKARKRLYLYISDKKRLHKLVEAYFKRLNLQPSNTNLFKALESTYISDLLEEVRVKVRKVVDGEVSFRQLSEGEQQLLTVLGLLKFTKDDESLVLLDEPDTHLNPLWKWEYLKLLNDVVKKPSDKDDDTTHVIINTHDPLVIGSLVHTQIRVFRRNEETGVVTATEPDISPKGLGVAGILTSELFGLPTILDEETQLLLNEKRVLQGKIFREKNTEKEYKRYKELKSILEKSGFYTEVEDIWFKMYLAEMSKHDNIKDVKITRAEQKELEEISRKAVDAVRLKMKKGS